MHIPSIHLASPIGCYSQQQPNYSRILRISALALGVVAILAGIMILTGILKVPMSLKIPLGISWIGVGTFSALSGLFLRCLYASANQIPNKHIRNSIVDRRTDGYLKYTWINHEPVKITYCYLKDFLKSKHQADRAILERLSLELKTNNWSKRLQDNFGTTDVVLSLPICIFTTTEKRNDDQLFQILRLILMSREEFLALPLAELKNFDEDNGEEQRNFLSLRCMCLDLFQSEKNTAFAEGSLGHFRSIFDLQAFKSYSRELYLFFSSQQVAYFLNNMEALFWTDDETIRRYIVNDLFPFHNTELPHISKRTENLLSILPAEKVNVLIPYFETDLIEHLMTTKMPLDYSRLTKNQVCESFICFRSGNIRAYSGASSISIDILNQILPKMNLEQLKSLGKYHLQNPKLNLRLLNGDQIKVMFPLSGQIAKTKEKIGWLSENNRAFVTNILSNSSA